MSDEIRALTLQRAAAEQIAAVAVSEGMRRLREDGFEKVKSGLTSMAEISRVTGQRLSERFVRPLRPFAVGAVRQSPSAADIRSV